MTTAPHATLDIRPGANPRDGGTHASFATRIPRDWTYLRGHFPGYPIVPGAAILIELVQHQVRALWPELGEPAAVRRLKFKRALGPGDEVEITLKRAQGPRVRFSVDRDGAACTSGVLDFAGAGAGAGSGQEPSP